MLRTDGNAKRTEKKVDPAFSGQFTLLNQDQGVRAVLQISNDLIFVRHDELHLRKWASDFREEDELAMVSEALKSIPKPLSDFLDQISQHPAQFDWRSANSPNLTEQERLTKLVYRGSGGYSEFRRQLLNHMVQQGGQVARAAQLVLRAEKKQQ